MGKFSNYLKQHAGELTLPQTGNDAICTMLNMSNGCDPNNDLKDRLITAINQRVSSVLNEQATGQIVTDINNINDLLKSYQDPKTSMTTKVVMALKVIRNTNSIDSGEFENMSRYIMFFAQISDSDSPNEVRNVLAAYTLPSVSFYTKREYGSHWMITSYLGVSGGKSEPKDLPDNNNKYGIFAPVGIEWSYGTSSNSSFSIMLAPLDFGYPISLKLNGIEQSAKLNDIIAPSLNISYGIRGYPIVIGLAYQRGRLIEATGQQERRIMVFFAFDMPLFGLN